MSPSPSAPALGATATLPYDASFYDVPAQRPSIRLAVDRVAVKGQKIPVMLRDALFETMALLFDVTAEVSLADEQRGIHMSRIESAFLEAAAGGGSLPQVAVAIAEHVRQLQQQQSAAAHLAGTVPLRTRTAVTDLTSPDTVHISAFAADGVNRHVGLALSVTNITACPCMQGYALSELIDVLGIDPDQGRRLLDRVPIATHSQKGNIRATVQAPDIRQLPDYAFIYQVLSSSTTLTQELLKRPDEYDLVRRSHLRPQFVEDVARTAAEALASALAAQNIDPDGVYIDVAAESHESIHGHDIDAHIHLALSTT